MNSALIGHTGFVGSNLDQQHAFSQRFNSKNIEEIRGQKFDLVVTAGVQAKKWWANQNPAEDWAQIERLLDALASVQAERFVLISTIDVYPKPCGVDESTPVEEDARNAYGTHRLRVEKAVQSRFKETCIIRLPGLFGNGLKKNVIFDLIHDNILETINPASRFQYYFLDHLWADINRCLNAKLPLVNFATEPVATSTILERFFPGKVVGSNPAPAAAYDFRTCHNNTLGGENGYLYDRETVVRDIGIYLKRAAGIGGVTETSE